LQNLRPYFSVPDTIWGFIQSNSEFDVKNYLIPRTTVIICENYSFITLTFFFSYLSEGGTDTGLSIPRFPLIDYL